MLRVGSKIIGRKKRRQDIPVWFRSSNKPEVFYMMILKEKDERTKKMEVRKFG